MWYVIEKGGNFKLVRASNIALAYPDWNVVKGPYDNHTQAANNAFRAVAKVMYPKEVMHA